MGVRSIDTEDANDLQPLLESYYLAIRNVAYEQGVRLTTKEILLVATDAIVKTVAYTAKNSNPDELKIGGAVIQLVKDAREH